MSVEGELRVVDRGGLSVDNFVGRAIGEVLFYDASVCLLHVLFCVGLICCCVCGDECLVLCVVLE